MLGAKQAVSMPWVGCDVVVTVDRARMVGLPWLLLALGLWLRASFSFMSDDPAAGSPNEYRYLLQVELSKQLKRYKK